MNTKKIQNPIDTITSSALTNSALPTFKSLQAVSPGEILMCISISDKAKEIWLEKCKAETHAARIVRNIEISELIDGKDAFEDGHFQASCKQIHDRREKIIKNVLSPALREIKELKNKFWKEVRKDNPGFANAGMELREGFKVVESPPYPNFIDRLIDRIITRLNRFFEENGPI